MIKLKRLALEAQEPTDSDQWDNWHEYIKYFEYDIEKADISKLIKRFGLKGKGFFDNRIIEIYGDEPVYLLYDSDNETFSVIKDITQWIWDVDASNIGVDPDTIYNNWVESSLKDLRQNPGKVYHYTTPEKFELIKQDGEMIGSYGTGINNRGSYGIFTSTDPQEYSLGTYGDICLEIDLESFKRDSGLPELNLEFEPEVIDYITREYLAHVLKIEICDDLPSDMSPYTVVVNHVIPIKYIRQI
jgi:hypothetical protein